MGRTYKPKHFSKQQTKIAKKNEINPQSNRRGYNDNHEIQVNTNASTDNYTTRAVAMNEYTLPDWIDELEDENALVAHL